MKTLDIDTLRATYKSHEKEALQDFFTFLRFQSVSTDPSYAPQVKECADWLVNYLREMKFHTELWPTAGYPTLFASRMEAGPDKPTLLIYNHYDVQPVDPIQDWVSPPFEPTIRNGEVYARGAQDNKGQCFTTLQALKILLKHYQKLPINIKLIIEGEEENGSTGIASLLKEKKEQLKADYLAIVDVGIQEKNSPSVTLGVRGIVTMDVELTGSKTDLHSGCHGGLAYNPLRALVELLAGLRDANGKIVIPGFYDDVIPLSDQERKQISLEFDAETYEADFGIKPTGGEKNLSLAERVWIRPALEINGVSGGYSGKGFKTVIPSHASAKVSCRIVPNQDPQKIGKLVAQYLESKAPEGISVRVHVHPGGGRAVRASPSSAVVKAFQQAFTEAFNKPCCCIFEGASIPIVTELAAASGSEVVLVGLGLPSDQIHAPNEHFGVDRLEKGAVIIARTIELLS
ncbi:MAG: dipeptidase [Parachlamydiaceae bacterium]|nr:dipeptidase [Parachlamydiaceae bacterium]